MSHLLVEFGLWQRRQAGPEGLQEGLDGGVQVRGRVRGGLDDEHLQAAQISKGFVCTASVQQG